MMKRLFALLRFLMVASIILAAAAPVSAKGKDTSGFKTGFDQWEGSQGEFANWETAGVLADGALQFEPAATTAETDPYLPGAYYGGNYYNGGSFWVGTATSPVMPVDFSFTEAIASWNAETPPGTWIEAQIRADMSGRWTKWYSLGIWASDGSAVQRHSVKLQGDGDGYVAVDTLVLSAKKAAATGYQLKFRLFSADNLAVPVIRNASVAYSTVPEKKADVSAGNPALWNTLIPVPECSQMVYTDGGNVWCSPTSVSMVLGYWGIDPGPCEPRVRATVEGVYDWVFDGHGNWPFNTAYAASRGMDAYVVRLTSLADAEPWIAAGVPVVMSIQWGKKDLTNATVSSTPGHLLVLVGFDANGNAIVNDPAAGANEDVQVTYLRSEFEPLWMEASGGTVYLIYPTGHSVPDL